MSPRSQNFWRVFSLWAILIAPVVSGADADLIVYDTASSGVPVTIASRHVIVGALDDKDVRTVIEVFVLANGSDRTRVAGACQIPSPCDMSRRDPNSQLSLKGVDHRIVVIDFPSADIAPRPSAKKFVSSPRSLNERTARLVCRRFANEALMVCASISCHRIPGSC